MYLESAVTPQIYEPSSSSPVAPQQDNCPVASSSENLNHTEPKSNSPSALSALPEVTSRPQTPIGPDDIVINVHGNDAHYDSEHLPYADGCQSLMRNLRPTVCLPDETVRRMGVLFGQQVGRAEAHARKEELARRTRIRQYEWMKASLGEEYAYWVMCRRELLEQRKRVMGKRLDYEDERDYEERRALLASGRKGALRPLRQREENIRRREEQVLKTLGLSKLDQPGGDEYGDRTTKSRRIRKRFHPYPTHVRRLWSKIPRYFNPYDTPFPEETEVDEDSKRHEAIFLELFEPYVNRWRELADPENKVALTFGSVPWPLQFPPNSLDAFTAENIWEFVLAGHFSESDGIDPDDCSDAAQEELERWRPDNVAKWILPRIADQQERETVRIAADLVLKALVRLHT